MAKDLRLFPDRDVKQVSLGDEGGSAGTQTQKKSAKEIMAAANEQRRIDSGQKSAKEIMAAANQQRLVDDAGRVDGAYISSFFQDAQSFLNQSQADLEGMSWASSRDQAAQANRNAQFSDLDYRAKVIGSFLENNKAGMDEDAYKELTAGLDSYNSLSSEAREYFDTLGKYYANFDSQEAFDADQRKGGYFQTYSGKTDEELAAALESLEKGSNTQATQLQAQKEALLQQGRDRLAAGAPEDEIRKLLEQAAQIDRQLQQAQSLAKDEESAWLNDYIAYRAYLQDEEWRSKYAGKSYKELMAILEKMDGSTKEAAWLEAYAPEAMTLKEAEIMYKSTTGKEQLFYTQLYNSKLMDQKIQILSKAKMPRGRTTVLEELQNIVENNGNVSESKKDAVKAQMRKAGVDPDEWYGLLTGDGNVNAGDLVDWAGASLQSGLGSFNKSVTSTLDVLIGKPLQALGWKNNPISSAAEYYSDQYDIQAYNRQLYKDKMGGGKGFDIAESLLESTVAAVPDALLAYMTAGASTTASSAKLASNAAYQGGSILTKAGITAKNMASNPGFWTSFGRTYGSDYEEAKAMGANDTTAALCATITSLLNSSIEIGLSGNSGIQGLPQEIAEGGSKKMLAWLISSAEEGGEEVLQGFVNDLVAKVSYDRSREIADLGKMAEEFGLGAGVGLILGGGQSVAASTVNAYSNREQNKKIKELYGSSVEELIQAGLETPEGSLSHSLALQYQQRVNNGKELSGGEIAKLIAANEDAFRAEVSQEQKAPPAATPGAEAVNDTAQQVQPQARPQIQEQVQPLEQQIPAEAAPMSAREAFQAEINRQVAGGNVLNSDTEALAEGVRARAAEALDSGEIDQEDYRMAMDELEQMDLEAEGRAHARANQEAQVETVWRKLGRKLGLVNENGGNANGTENYERQSEAARSYLYAGGGQRDAGTGAGGQAASMAEGPGIPQPGADTGAEAAGSADSSQSIRVSGQSLGVSRSTGEASIRMIPPQAWTDEQVTLAQEIQEKTGKQAVFILDTIPVRKTDGGLRQARGAFTGEQVIVQVNNREADAEQIAAHEIYHAQNAYLDGKLNEEVKAKIIERFSKEEFEAVVAEYVKALEGVYDVGTGVSEAMNKAALELIEEEVLADAYAGINAFGANAGRFGWAAWEKTNELGLGYPGKEMSRELGSGPPAQRYSFAGTKAKTADLDAFRRAKELHSIGVDSETIRIQTGWHLGMDGKWRWEIDDSGMEYSGRGDLGLRERRPDYARYRELLDKANRHALELSDEALTPEEKTELQKLKDIWGGTFRKAGRITEDALPTELLSDYVKHDALFEAYPQLRKTKLRFADLPEGTRGQYSQEEDAIILSEKLRGKPQDTLIHEIQHVIQKTEGFAQGSSPEFWEQVQKGEQPVRANDRRVAEAERRIQEIMDSLPPFVAGQFELHRHLEKSVPDKAMELADALSEGPYGDEFSDFFLLTWDLDMAAGEDNYIRGAGDLYRNTAGEIEARDAASRRQLTAEQRRSTAPARADNRTVFVEDVDDLSLQLGDRFSVDDADDQVAIGDLQAELHRLQNQRSSLLEADPAYAAAEDNLRYANTFTEKVAARKAMAAAAANIDTAAIDQRISNLQDQINEIRNREIRQHREDQEKYSETKTAGYSTMPDTRLKDLDRDYMQAVRSGDRTRMAELVEEAAEAAMPASVVRDKSGRLLKTYHHTGSSFTVFDRNMARTGTEMDGFFFAPDPNSTSEYGPNMITAYLNITKLAIDPKLDRKFNDSGTLLREKLAYQGYDGMARTEYGKIYEYMAFDPEQIKSADPVVYDDRGRVIPLSERFDFHNPDIRYSVDTGSYEPSVEEDEARVAYFEDMGAQRKQQYVEGIREAESDARLEYFEQQAELQPGEDADPEQVAKEVEEIRRRSEPKPEPAEAEPVTSIAREDLPAKARDNLAREEAAALRGLRKSFGVTQTNAREFLKETVQQISDEYLATGKISQKTADRLFEDAWKKGEIEDREFYDQYKHIKEKLRTTAVTLDKRDQEDIADFNKFKQICYQTLRIVNKGGMPVDSLYEELRGMAPELFPESITHPADQLVTMYEVGKSIVKRKASLDAYYGPAAASMKQYARESFEGAIYGKEGFERKLWAVRRFGSDKAAQAEQKAQKPKVRTLEEALEASKKMKDARRASERAVAKNLLTASDEEIVGKLLRGEMSLAQLDPSKDNVEGIRAVYEAKRAYEEAVKPIAEYKRLVHAQLRSKADGFLDTANSWKDKKSGLAYSRETMTRNIYDIVPDKALAKRILQAYFEPVQIAEAARTRFKTEMRDRVRAMKLSRNVAKGNIISEAAAVQILGEAQDNMESLKRTQAYIKTRDGKTLDEWGAVIENLWLNNPKLDKGKIQRSVEEFRKIYDELFTKMNEARVRFGYEPVSYRKGYFPHFQPDGGDGIMAFFGKALGIDTQVDVLPTTINGLTHTFRPGTTWFGNAQERLGFNTVYDAVEGFDRYIEGVSDVIYHTENIQNLRALASQMRYRTSEEGLRKQADEIMADPKLSDYDKELRLKDLYAKGKYALSNFVNELEEYTNLLANKKSRLDRAAEMLIGRGRLYRGMRWVNSRVAANMVGGNVSSAMTNFIPVVQAAGRVGDKNILLGMWDTMRGAKDGITEKSDFLASRRGSDVLVKTRVQKASEFVGGLMNIVDNFTSGTIVRAAYYKNLESGMSEAEALHEADVFAAGVMAGRAKGDMPTLFHSVNPLIKMFTQFQLEVNNQYSEVFKDMPRQHRGQAAYKFAMAILGYFVRAYLFNELFELLFGRRSALDPINLLNEFVGDATGYEIPSLSSIVAGEATFKTERKNIGGTAKNLAQNALSDLPFSSILNAFIPEEWEFELDGGRVPMESAMPNIPTLLQVAFNDNWAPEYKKKKAMDELSKLMYVIPPFGGGQALKTWKGLNAYMKGGSYSMDSKGNELLQYPIYKDSPIEALGNALRTAVMGKSSVPEAVEWVEDGFDSFGSKQTAMYKDMLDAGVKARDAYELIDALRSAEETDSKAKKDVQLEIIRSSKISDEAKAIAVYGFIDSDSLEEVMDLLDDAGVDAGTILDVVYGYREAQLLEKGTKAAQRQVILDADLTDSEKLLLVGELIGTDMETAAGKPTEYAKLLEAMDEGMSVDDYLKLVQAEGDIDDYLEYTEAGLSNEQALRVVDALEDLEPMDGKDKVVDIQRWKVCVEFSSNEAVQLAALCGAMNEDQFAKVQIAYDFEVTPSSYIKLQEIKVGYDTDQNGHYTNKEIQAAIDSMSGLTTEQKAVLWQLVSPSTSAKNNPYNRQVGQAVLDAKERAKDTPWH